MLREWKAEHGEFCPGAPDLNHPPHPSRDLTVDHILPLGQGGTHHPSNLRVLCRSANSNRGAPRPG